MVSKNRNLNEEGWKCVLFEGQWSNGAALNHREFEKSNVDLKESLGRRFEEPNVGLGVTLNRHEFKSTAGRR